MRYFVDIDAQHFAVFERIHEEGRCPTCGHSVYRPVRSRLLLVRGERNEENDWVVVKEQGLDHMPINPESANEQARKFALAS